MKTRRRTEGGNSARPRSRASSTGRPSSSVSRPASPFDVVPQKHRNPDDYPQTMLELLAYILGNRARLRIVSAVVLIVTAILASLAALTAFGLIVSTQNDGHLPLFRSFALASSVVTATTAGIITALTVYLNSRYKSRRVKDGMGPIVVAREMSFSYSSTAQALVGEFSYIESLARKLTSQEFDLDAANEPLGRVVAFLVRLPGWTDSDASDLREVLKLRNELVHGNELTEARIKSGIEMAEGLTDKLAAFLKESEHRQSVM